MEWDANKLVSETPVLEGAALEELNAFLDLQVKLVFEALDERMAARDANRGARCAQSSARRSEGPGILDAAVAQEVTLDLNLAAAATSTTHAEPSDINVGAPSSCSMKFLSHVIDSAAPVPVCTVTAEVIPNSYHVAGATSTIYSEPCDVDIATPFSAFSLGANTVAMDRNCKLLIEEMQKMEMRLCRKIDGRCHSLEWCVGDHELHAAATSISTFNDVNLDKEPVFNEILIFDEEPNVLDNGPIFDEELIVFDKGPIFDEELTVFDEEPVFDKEHIPDWVPSSASIDAPSTCSTKFLDLVVNAAVPTVTEEVTVDLFHAATSVPLQDLATGCIGVVLSDSSDIIVEAGLPACWIDVPVVLMTGCDVGALDSWMFSLVWVELQPWPCPLELMSSPDGAVQRPRPWPSFYHEVGEFYHTLHDLESELSLLNWIPENLLRACLIGWCPEWNNIVDVLVTLDCNNILWAFLAKYPINVQWSQTILLAQQKCVGASKLALHTGIFMVFGYNTVSMEEVGLTCLNRLTDIEVRMPWDPGRQLTKYLDLCFDSNVHFEALSCRRNLSMISNSAILFFEVEAMHTVSNGELLLCINSQKMRWDPGVFCSRGAVAFVLLGQCLILILEYPNCQVPASAKLQCSVKYWLVRTASLSCSGWQEYGHLSCLVKYLDNTSKSVVRDNRQSVLYVPKLLQAWDPGDIMRRSSRVLILRKLVVLNLSTRTTEFRAWPLPDCQLGVLITSDSSMAKLSARPSTNVKLIQKRKANLIRVGKFVRYCPDTNPTVRNIVWSQSNMFRLHVTAAIGIIIPVSFLIWIQRKLLQQWGSSVIMLQVNISQSSSCDNCTAISLLEFSTSLGCSYISVILLSEVGELHPVSVGELLICAKNQLDVWDPGGQQRLGGKPHFKERGMSGMGRHHVGLGPEESLPDCLASTTRGMRHQRKQRGINLSEQGSCSSSSSSLLSFPSLGFSSISLSSTLLLY